MSIRPVSGPPAPPTAWGVLISRRPWGGRASHGRGAVSLNIPYAIPHSDQFCTHSSGSKTIRSSICSVFVRSGPLRPPRQLPGRSDWPNDMWCLGIPCKRANQILATNADLEINCYIFEQKQVQSADVGQVD
ncbi:unnamed protein product [Rodentolepis nana]|uniref:Uncharacterized protein n=1 Tax=Rodentolepis nana TaxID=102285 RepID=A0A0R3TQ83_RODNA|nr:unnamed protein product [Rodentolepis nana]